MFQRVLIANRGEIAVRLARAARLLGIETVAVHSDVDAGSPHVRAADRAVEIGPAPAVESYLDIERIVRAARDTGAEAIHPGYGFLAENPGLARACVEAGLTFVGPPAEVMESMGSKTEAKRIAREAGVPVVPGYDGDDQTDARLGTEAERVGYPLLVKASAGGGGKGMRRIDRSEDLPEGLATARREALAAFGDDRLLLERAVAPVRHVEIQVFGDGHGQVVHLFERECSIQRRHQKIVEESPSPALDADLRARMGEAAVSVTRHVGYRNAGTVEFLLDRDGAFYFLEMNTRLQVEHPVTELVTGVDLAALSFREAAGEPLPFRQEELSTRGHAFECRVYAEDPSQGFLPSPGPILLLREPTGPGLRIDSGVASGWQVPEHYDPILSKVVTWGADREEARRRMVMAMRQYVLLGIRTNVDYLIDVLEHPAFVRGELSTAFLDEHLSDWAERRPEASPWVLAGAAAERLTAGAAGRDGSGGTLRPDPYSPWGEGSRWRQQGMGEAS